LVPLNFGQPERLYGITVELRTREPAPDRERTEFSYRATGSAEAAIPDDSQLRPAVSHRMLVVLTADQRGAAVLIAGKPT
jgi:hypothetical protein